MNTRRYKILRYLDTRYKIWIYTRLAFNVFQSSADNREQFLTILPKRLKEFFVYVLTAVKEFKPITCFSSLFLGDLQFCSKVFFTGTINSFGNICANTGATSQNLFGYNKFFMIGHQIFIEANDPQRECKTLFS